MIALCWSRHVHARTPELCAVVERAGRSVVTACRGRWEVHALDVITWDAPADKRLKCGGCERELAVDESADDGTIVVDVDDASDPAWVRGAEEARERLARRGR